MHDWPNFATICVDSDVVICAPITYILNEYC